MLTAIISSNTQVDISDPVTYPDGHTYERKALEKWVHKHGKSPMNPSCWFIGELQQIHNNFLNLGVQSYGGELYREITEKTNEIFNELTFPEPSIHRETTVQCRGMNYYNNSSNPCFSGECMVEMANGKLKSVEQVRQGDRVQTEFGNAYVYCVLKTHCRGGQAKLVKMPNGLRVTPYHPIKWNGEWVHPVTLFPSTRMPCQAVYSFLLGGDDHTMIINGTTVISLAHGRTKGILEHWYYGTKKVVDFLMSCPGWHDGLVQLRSGCIHTSQDSNFNGLVYNF
jgi:hypothetical protein